MSLPSKVGLPAEVQPSLSYSLPASARSYAVRVQPTNLSSITSSTLSSSTTVGYLSSDLAFPNTNVIFDLPTSQSPSTFLDTRFTTLNFKATLNITTAGTLGTGTAASAVANQRGGGASWFDLMTIYGGDGAVLEQINEYGLVNDTITQLMMNQSQRDGAALPYGFLSSTNNENQGHTWNVLTASVTNAAGSTESHSYSIPIMSGLIGAAADSFLNIGRVSKLQLVMQTPSVLPITINNQAQGSAISFNIVLSDFTLGLEYVDVGMDALGMIDQTLIDGQFYSHGTTYKTSSTALAATSGSVSLLSGLRGSSLKSLITRFQENALTTAGGVNGKYDSKCPNLSAFSYSIGGVKYPQASINCLTQPALAYTETLKAVGAFNSALFNPSIIPAQYCVLSVGGVAQAYTGTAGSDYTWNTSSTAATKQAGFFVGENLEKCAKKGVFSGLDATSAPIFNEMTIQNAITNAHNVYNVGFFDAVYIHNVQNGLIQVRM
jgi:hypothetical protein